MEKNASVEPLYSVPNSQSEVVEKQIPLKHLKSVLLKILSVPKTSSEHNQLIKVLKAFLELDTTESKVLEDGLCGTTQSPNAEGIVSSLKSYIPGWTVS